MGLTELLLIAVGLSMDAFAVGLTNGMTEPDMKTGKMFLIALFYGAFQCFMPLAGYYGGSVFVGAVETIAPWVSFGLLVFIGGKMVADTLREQKTKLRRTGGALVRRKKLTIGALVAQAVATSVDALAVGVSLLAQETAGALPFSAVFCAAFIGAVTFFLSLVAVTVGRTAGNRFSDRAEIFGGIVLIAIGVKLLLDGIL